MTGSPTESKRAGSTQGGSALTFFGLLFLLSVPFWIGGAIFSNPRMLPMGLPVSAFQFVLPLAVAAILLYRRQRWQGVGALLRRTFTVRGSGRPAWWIPTVALVPVLMAATYATMLLARIPPHGSHSPLSAVPILLLIYAIAAVCEEAGWMGYAVHPLRARWGPLGAGLVLGSVWAVWHLVGFIQAGRSAGWIVGQCLGTVAIRVLMVWLFDFTGGVVATAVVVHTLVNVSQSVFPGFTGQAAPALVYGLFSALTAAIIAWRWKPKRSRRPLP